MRQNKDSKLGLALSGGGVRSALFHVGVLARLAELDLLGKIDVISSVSGGSIIAAYYYLKVMPLHQKLQSDHHAKLDRESYIQVVAEIEADFLKAVQQNMRLRTFLDPIKNARMLAADYSNTERLAELLTTYFYSPILQDSGEWPEHKLISLKNIFEPFAVNNPVSESRPPDLIINATSLNTGHLWQFTNDSVGEQPTPGEAGDTSVGFFRKFRYQDDRLTVEQMKILYNITLGQAVAASCCVPGIFEPLQIRNLYGNGKKTHTVRLVDGGLVDNQGLASLFSENCTHIICSDASDILKFESAPSTQILNVALRANDILMDRIRSKAISTLLGYGAGHYALFDLGDRETRSKIFPEDSETIIEALTRIRTDLDSFTDLEAYTLMYCGYQLSGIELEKNGFEMVPQHAPKAWDWRFLEIRDGFLKNDKKRQDLIFHLQVGSRQMFKIFMLKKKLPYMIMMPIPILITLFSLYLIKKSSILVFWGILLSAVLMLIYTQNHRLLKLMDNVAVLRKLKQGILKTMLSTRLPEPFSYLIASLAWIQLNVFDRLFLKYGQVRKGADKS